MKKLIKKWLLSILGSERHIILPSKKSCGLIIKDGYFLLTAPDGTILPQQYDLTIVDSVGHRNIVLVTVQMQLKMSISEWEDLN